MSHKHIILFHCWVIELELSWLDDLLLSELLIVEVLASLNRHHRHIIWIENWKTLLLGVIVLFRILRLECRLDWIPTYNIDVLHRNNLLIVLTVLVIIRCLLIINVSISLVSISLCSSFLLNLFQL